MANVFDVKARDHGREIAADDPLMELSRIMGFDKPRAPAAPEPIDPQIAIEDSFSLDLERELALEEAAPEPATQLDDEFDAAFEDELSGAIQFGEDAPSVVPSLEDELSALLEEREKPVSAASVISHSGNQWTAPARSEPDVSWQEDALYLDAQADAVGVQEISDTAESALVEPALQIEEDLSWQDINWDDLPAAGAQTQPAAALPESVEVGMDFDENWLDENLEVGTSPQVAAPQSPEAAAEPWFNDDFAIAADRATPASEFVDEANYSSPVSAGVPAAADEFDAEDLDLGDLGISGEHRPDELAGDAQLGAMDFDFALDEPEVSEPQPIAASLPLQHAPSPVAWPQPEFDEAQLQDEDLADDFDSRADDLAPIVETAEPVRDAVAQTDEFEIPDFDFAPEPQPASAAFSYEPEYAGFEPAAPKAPAAASGLDADFEAMLDEQLASDHGLTTAGLASAAGMGAALRPRASERIDADLDFQPFANEEPAFPGVAEPLAQSARKPWLVPSALAAVLVLCGGAYYAFSGSSSNTAAGGTALVKADPQPVKIAPENPGGKAVPDQDKAVYNNVGGEQDALPSQGTLVSESEEPVDIASVTPSADEPVKSEARVDAAAGDTPAAPSAETAAVSPKKVRTFIVKPDGTLVERPAEAAAAAPAAAEVAPATIALDQPVAVPAAKPAVSTPEAPAAQTAEAVPAEVPSKTETATAEAPSATDADALAKLASAEPETAQPAAVAEEPQAEKPAPAVKVVKTKKIKAPVEETAAAAPADAAPVLESRPSDQPVNIVGKTGGADNAAPAQDVQVAAADATPAPSAGGYAIQIASTPSPEAAKSTYAALSRKFGGVIGGRGVNIQKAQVDGKGTVYRVRIPAGSKQEAAALCAQYKASGGNCFVTK